MFGPFPAKQCMFCTPVLYKQCFSCQGVQSFDQQHQTQTANPHVPQHLAAIEEISRLYTKLLLTENWVPQKYRSQQRKMKGIAGSFFHMCDPNLLFFNAMFLTIGLRRAAIMLWLQPSFKQNQNASTIPKKGNNHSSPKTAQTIKNH